MNFCFLLFLYLRFISSSCRKRSTSNIVFLQSCEFRLQHHRIGCLQESLCSHGGVCIVCLLVMFFLSMVYRHYMPAYICALQHRRSHCSAHQQHLLHILLVNWLFQCREFYNLGHCWLDCCHVRCVCVCVFCVLSLCPSLCCIETETETENPNRHACFCFTVSDF